MNSIEEWLRTIGKKVDWLEVASSDASFRKYYRFGENGSTFIVMDSSLQKDSLTNFVEMTHRLSKVNVAVPKIYLQEDTRGYLLLEDLGCVDLLDSLDTQNFEHYYKKAIDIIVQMQNSITSGLPLYDREFLLFEMDLMRQWYLQKNLQTTLNADNIAIIDVALNYIADEVLLQPQGFFVHRDFHSRNIMLQDDMLRVIDYQDARVGAITYDLVSLLRDCYVSFDASKIEKLALYFRDLKKLDVSDTQFLRWFDFMGLQRHIKILGVFSRLALRDNKKRYLTDIPQTLRYIFETGDKYPQLESLMKLLRNQIAS